MKRITVLLGLLLMAICGQAQNTVRQSVSGTVVFPLEEDLSGISIINMNSGVGTITNLDGDFSLQMSEEDSISVSSVQFKEFKVAVTKSVIESKKMYIYVKQLANQLPEVLVSPVKLTGDLSSDIANVEVVRLPLGFLDAPKNNYKDYGGNYNETHPRDAASLSSHTRLVDGLNFVNLFKLLLVENKKERVSNPYKTPELLATEIRKIYNDQFFKENLNIELNNINNFIDYADENGLSEHMLKNGNELDLIQFLIEQSKKYKKLRAKE